MYGLITGIRDETGIADDHRTARVLDDAHGGWLCTGGQASRPSRWSFRASDFTTQVRDWRRRTLDLRPCSCLAGEVPRGQIGKGLDGLHEIVNQADLMKPITKYRKSIMRPHEAPAAINEAFKQMRSGRPRPTFIDMPPEGMVEREEVELLESQPGDRFTADDSLIEQAARDILNAKTAVIFAGGGIARSDAFDELAQLAEMTGLPVVNSAGGKGVIPYSHPNSIGTWVGAEGPIKDMIDGAEVILAIGTRFTPRNPIGGSSKVIQIDPDDQILGRANPKQDEAQGRCQGDAHEAQRGVGRSRLRS